jgi:hypothetical protein
MRIVSPRRRCSRGLLAAAVSLTAPAAALAHPGHDHAHWASAGIHGLLLIGMAAVGAAGVWALARRQGRARRTLVTRSDD